MEALEKYFDHYVINARLKPIFFALLPFAITTLVWCPKAENLSGVVLTFLITFGVMAFLSNLVSNQGNQLQNKLFDDWGGAPTTILLRHSDNILDIHTKRRYHKWLGSKLPELEMPSHENEVANPANADSVYTSAVFFLREYTRDKSNYPMIYGDNVAYGFARNLLAIRPIGIGVAFVSILLNTVFLYEFYGEFLLWHTPSQNISKLFFGIGAIVVAITLIYVFYFVINSRYVYGRGIRYAKSLLAACEKSM